MSSTQKAFGEVVQILRKTRNISQEKFSDMSRAFISDIEQGKANPSLETVFKISEAFKINPAELISLTVEKLGGKKIPDEIAPINFAKNASKSADFSYAANHQFSADDVVLAAINTNTTIRAFSVLFEQVSKVRLFEVIDKKQTGSFLGAIFVSSMAEISSGHLAKNPSQTGHPDLIPKEYISDGKAYHWDQFPHGGVEIKTSCGSLKRGIAKKLDVGKSRIAHTTSIVWKGHHDKINNLLGLYWDYYAGEPTVLAGFYSNKLVPKDFTHTVPKPGGGHTTNVCITMSSATAKMGANWVFMVNQPAYIELFKKKMKVLL